MGALFTMYLESYGRWGECRHYVKMFRLQVRSPSAQHDGVSVIPSLSRGLDDARRAPLGSV